MIYDKYGCSDDAQYEEEQEKIKEKVFENYPEELEEKADEIREEKLWQEITTLYKVKNYYNCMQQWEQLNSDDKLAYCKLFLKAIDSDDFPLQRQVSIFTNFVKLNLREIEMYQIMESVTYTEMNNDSEILHITYLIPKKHYKAYIDKLYRETDIKSLQIKRDNPTEYLQELLEIWYLYKQDFSPYEISKDLIPYKNGVSYEPKQIERKLTAIRTLLQ